MAPHTPVGERKRAAFQLLLWAVMMFRKRNDVSPLRSEMMLLAPARNDELFALHVPQDTSCAQRTSLPQAASFARKGKHHCRRRLPKQTPSAGAGGGTRTHTGYSPNGF